MLLTEVFVLGGGEGGQAQWRGVTQPESLNTSDAREISPRISKSKSFPSMGHDFRGFEHVYTNAWSLRSEVTSALLWKLALLIGQTNLI